jgi:hypothetical protein
MILHINNRAYSYIFFLLRALLVKQQINWSTRSLLILDMRACSRSYQGNKYQVIILRIRVTALRLHTSG